MSRFLRSQAALAAAAAALTLAACANDAPSTDETGAPGSMPPPPTEISAIQTEYMSLQQRLGPLQQKAMQDSALQVEYAEIGDYVEEAMLLLDPELQEHRDRMTSIQGELQGLSKDGDQEKMQALIQEGTSLQQQLQQTQSEVMGQDSVSAKMTAFQEKVIAKMTELDSETPQLIERVNFLAEQIRSGAHPPVSE